MTFYSYKEMKQIIVDAFVIAINSTAEQTVAFIRDCEGKYPVKY